LPWTLDHTPPGLWTLLVGNVATLEPICIGRWSRAASIHKYFYRNSCFHFNPGLNFDFDLLKVTIQGLQLLVRKWAVGKYLTIESRWTCCRTASSPAFPVFACTII
jgi:hypothetical protein